MPAGGDGVRSCGRLHSARAKPPPSTETPSRDVRIDRSGWPRRHPLSQPRPRATVPGREAGGSCAGPGFYPGLGAAVARVAWPAQGQGAALSSLQARDLDTETARLRPRGIRRFLWGRTRRAAERPIRIDLPVGHPARPDALDRTRGPSGDRPRSPSRTRPTAAARGRLTASSRTARSQKDDKRVSSPTYVQEHESIKDRMRSHWVSVIGGRPRGDEVRGAPQGRLTAGWQDVHSISNSAVGPGSG